MGLYFQEDTFCYENKINVHNPDILIEITSSQKMQQLDRLEYPNLFGCKEVIIPYGFRASLSDLFY